MEKLTLHVPQISCQHCINNIKRELMGLPGVLEVFGDVGEKRIVVTFDSPADVSRIKGLLEEIGYPGSEV